VLSGNFRCTVGQQHVRNADIVGEFGKGLRDPGFWVNRGEIAVDEYLGTRVTLNRYHF
jgi:hypothetical protein